MISLVQLTFTILSLFYTFITTSTPISSHTITINNNGNYTPTTLTIHQNDVVIFQNSSTKDIWPASNIHPTHGIYPEFDPQTPIPPGQSWQFSFTKSGTWRFHDHLTPTQTGIIHVVSGAKIQTKSQEKMLTFQDKMKITFAKTYYIFNKDQLKKDFKTINVLDASDNYQHTLATWIKIVGPESVMEKLLIDAGQGEKIDCHQQAHNIGRLSYQVFGAESFAKGNSNCHSGYYHGMIEQYFNEQGTESLPQKVTTLCNTFKTEFGQFECLHGIGHGIMAYLDYDLPEALNECKSLETPFQKESCFGGVFMENIVTGEGKGAKNAHETKWLNADPHFPCNAVDKDYPTQSQCYLIQTARMLDLNEYDFKKVIPLCLDAPAEMQRVCYQSLGRDAAGQVLRDPQKINEICNNVPSEFKNDCSRGALYVILEFWGEKMTDQGVEFCNSQKTEQEISYCYEMFINRLPDFFSKDDSKLKEICEKVDPQYKTQCQRNLSHN